jgi:hypothetical protein
MRHPEMPIHDVFTDLKSFLNMMAGSKDGIVELLCA